MSTFKVGDKVRRIGGNCEGTVTGGIYTVKGFRQQGGTIMLLEFPAGELGWSACNFELAQEPVLTPEEVFKHLRKGTELQWFCKSTNNWIDHSGELSKIKLNELLDYNWHIKPVPEILEANGRKYKLIEE